MTLFILWRSLFDFHSLCLRIFDGSQFFGLSNSAPKDLPWWQRGALAPIVPGESRYGNHNPSPPGMGKELHQVIEQAPHYSKKGPDSVGALSLGFDCIAGRAALYAAIRSRLAPRARCVQRCCASKPGGVIESPPEAVELTACLYPLGGVWARGFLVAPTRKRIPCSFNRLSCEYLDYLMKRFSRN
jgi:hypothetical protein